jgi:predicted nuclease of restriction endonuclease-like RecB superfamily
MLTGDLLRVRTSQERVVPLYINRTNPQWLEAAESLLLVFREGVGLTRGEIEQEIDDLFGGGGKATLVHRGLAKVLEDRAEFEVVADVPPEQIRDKVFTAAAEYRRRMRATRGDHEEGVKLSGRPTFRREEVLSSVARELDLTPETLLNGLFADLRDENRLL